MMKYRIIIRSIIHTQITWMSRRKNGYVTTDTKPVTVVVGYSTSTKQNYRSIFEGTVDKELAAHWARQLFENEGA